MSFRTVTEVADVSAPDDAVFSLIDRHTTVDGKLTTSYDLRVDGQVLGTLQCNGTLYVSEGAAVDATIDAGNVVVAGAASGVIRCHGRLEIQTTGIVRAEVTTVSLVILEGAVFEGQIHMEAPPEGSAEIRTQPSAGAGDEQGEAYSFVRRFRSPDETDSGDSDLPAAPDEDEST